jgi:hypothetical protein
MNFYKIYIIKKKDLTNSMPTKSYTLTISLPSFQKHVDKIQIALINSAGLGKFSNSFEIHHKKPHPVPVPPPISNICFPAGTPIDTDQETVPIDEIDIEYHTINNKRIVAVTETVSLENHLILFPSNCLGDNIPSEITLVSNHHLVQNPCTQEMIKAEEYVGMFPKVSKAPYNQQFLYNILLDDYGLIKVNNMICETLKPNSMIAFLYQKLSTVTEDNDRKLWIEEYNRQVV